jgi:transposase-like protein
MADTADRILDDLRRRRDELRPLVGELERIEAAIQALERANAGGNGSARAPAAAPGRRRRGRPRKGEPNRTDQFLELVRSGGISIPAAARELGIGPNYLYRIAGTLEREGTIRKQGREFVMNVESQSSENAEVLPEPSDDDLVTDEGVNEGMREMAEEQPGADSAADSN